VASKLNAPGFGNTSKSLPPFGKPANTTPRRESRLTNSPFVFDLDECERTICRCPIFSFGRFPGFDRFDESTQENLGEAKSWISIVDANTTPGWGGFTAGSFPHLADAAMGIAFGRTLLPKPRFLDDRNQSPFFIGRLRMGG